MNIEQILIELTTEMKEFTTSVKMFLAHMEKLSSAAPAPVKRTGTTAEEQAVAEEAKTPEEDTDNFDLLVKEATGFGIEYSQYVGMDGFIRSMRKFSEALTICSFSSSELKKFITFLKEETPAAKAEWEKKKEAA